MKKKVSKKAKAKAYLEKLLYFQDAYEAIDYLNEPTDSMEIDFDRLVNHQPFYVDRISNAHKRPKKIIINDLGIIYGLIDQGHERFYKFLFEHTDELYIPIVYASGKYKLVEVDSYEKLAQRFKNLEFLDPNNIDLPDDTFELIDYDKRLKITKKINSILGDKKIPIKNFNTMPTLLDSSEDDDNQKLNNVLQNRRIAYIEVPSENLFVNIKKNIGSEIVLEELVFDYVEFIKNYSDDEQKIILNYIFSKKYKKVKLISLQDDDLSKLIINNICERCEVQAIDFAYQAPFDNDYLIACLEKSANTIQHIFGLPTIDIDLFKDIANKLPQLKGLGVDGVEDEDEILSRISDRGINLSNLKYLTIEDIQSEADLKTILKLLSSNPQIEKLNLSTGLGGRRLSEQFAEQIDSLISKMPSLSLKELVINCKGDSNDDLPINQLAKLVSKCPNLNKLEFVGCSALNLNAVAKYSFPLKSLKLRCDVIHLDGLYECLAKFTDLKELSINSEVKGGSGNYHCPKNLTLKKITFEQDSEKKILDIKDFRDILKASKDTLEYLSVNDDCLSGEITLKNDFLLPKLKSLKFTSSIDGEDQNRNLIYGRLLEAIILATTEMESLTVKNQLSEDDVVADSEYQYFFDYRFINDHSEKFKRLKKIKLDGFILDTNYLDSLSQEAVELEDVYINCDIETSIMSEKYGSDWCMNDRINDTPPLSKLTVKSDKIQAFLFYFWDAKRIVLKSRFAQLFALDNRFPAAESITCVNSYLSNEELCNLSTSHPNIFSFKMVDTTKQQNDHQDINRSFGRYSDSDIERINDHFIENDIHFSYNVKGINQTQANEILNLVNRPMVRLDKDTKLYDFTLDAKRYFESIPPHLYRLEVYKGYKLENGVGSLIEHPFNAEKLQSVHVEQLSMTDLIEKYDELHASNPRLHLGGEVYKVKPGQWLPLPSTASIETLKYINHDIDIGYDPEVARYYFKLKDHITTTQTLDVRFIAEIKNIAFNLPMHPNYHPYLELVRKLRFGLNGLIKDQHYYQLATLSAEHLSKLFYYYIHDGFSKDGTELTGTINNDTDILNALLTQRTGKCDHRTYLYSALATEFGIPHTPIFNDVHAFVGVSQTDERNQSFTLTFDLGGYPAEIKEAKKDFREADKSNLTENVLNDKFLTQDVLPEELISDIDENQPSIFEDQSLNKDTSRFIDFESFFSEQLEKSKSLPANKRNILVAIEDHQVAAFHAALLKYYKDNPQKMHYVPNLNAIFDKQGSIVDGEIQQTASSLASFAANAHIGDALIVNWSNYNAMHLGHNSIMDDKRRIGSNSIPDGVANIGFITRSQIDRLGEDLTSRFKIYAQCPSSVLVDEVCPFSESIDDFPTKISLLPFYTENWRGSLVGKVSFQNGKPSYTPGALLEALNKNQNGIVLQNAPWHLEDFKLFYNELIINKCFVANGITYQLPENFSIHRSDEPFKLNLKNVSIDYAAPPEFSYVLNQQSFSSFMGGTEIINKMINQHNGILDQHADVDLNIYVTDSEISHKQWALLLAESIKRNCHLKLHVAEGVTVPDEILQLHLNAMSHLPEDQAIPMQMDAIPNQTNIKVIETKDLEAAEFYIKEQFPEAETIFVHGQSTFSELMGHPVKNPSGGEYSFEFEFSHIYKLLKEGKTVVLKGNMPKKIRQQLESLFLDDPYIYINGAKEYFSGKLILLTSTANAIPFIKPVKIKVSSKQSWNQLSTYLTNKSLFNMFSKAVDNFEDLTNYKFSYVQLKTMLQKLETGNLSDPFAAFFRLLPDEKLRQAKKIWPRKMPEKPSEMTADAFLDRRKAKFIKQVKSSPYTFMVGSSGAGKSTFLLDTFENDPSVNIYTGTDKMIEWAENKNDSVKILFLDEANLERPGVWESLQGIFDEPPGVFIQNKYYPLLKGHKIVMAGNYNTFEGRHQHTIFTQRGNIITFKDLPNVVLREKIIKPALAKLFPGNILDAEAITNIFLSFYNKINNELSDSKPLTPRNIKTMCLRFKYYTEQYHQFFDGDDNLEKMAYMAAYDVVATSLNKSERQNLKASLKENNTLSNVERKHVKQKIKRHLNLPEKMIITKSRKNPLRLMRDGLAMREIKLRDKELHDLFLPGLLYEGGSGIGKSTMIFSQLTDLKYVPATAENINMTNRYYVLTPGKRDEMRKQLFQAFHEGAVIVVDEFNSLFLEKELNAYFSGVDLDGNRADKSGFYMIATQNPISMKHRPKLSEAMLKRLQKIDLKDYTLKELIEIVTKLTGDDKFAKVAVRDYWLLLKKEKKENSIFKSTPRTLFDIVINWSKSQKRPMESTEEKTKSNPNPAKRPRFS